MGSMTENLICGRTYEESLVQFSSCDLNEFYLFRGELGYVLSVDVFFDTFGFGRCAAKDHSECTASENWNLIDSRYNKHAFLMQPLVEHLTVGHRGSPSFLQAYADLFNDWVKRTTFATDNGR